MIRARTRTRLLALVMASALVAQSVSVVWAVRRCRRLCDEAAAECAALRSSAAAALRSCEAAVDAVRSSLSAVESPTASVCADAGPPAPTTRAVGVGTNGKYRYVDISTDYHDGSPPEVRRVYARIPPESRSPCFRPTD